MYYFFNFLLNFVIKRLGNSRTLIDFGLGSDMCSEETTYELRSEQIEFTSADSAASYFAASEFDTSTRKEITSSELLESDIVIQDQYILNDDWFGEDAAITVRNFLLYYFSNV